MRPHRRARFVFLFMALGLVLPSCGGSSKPEVSGPNALTSAPSADPTEGSKPQAVNLRDEVPSDQLSAVMRANLQGLGFMERYQYGKASEAFREVHERAPGWAPGSINLAIALLNDTGTKAEAAKKAHRNGEEGNFGEALQLLNEVIERDPTNLSAHYCRGLILEFQGRSKEAHEDFKVVTEKDPTDGHAWLKFGMTLPSSEDPDRPATIKDAPALIAIYQKALDQNPYLITALYRLQQAYSWAREPAKQKELLLLWRRLNPKEPDSPAGPGDTAEAFYGEAGKYAKVLNPLPSSASGSTTTTAAPRFDHPQSIVAKLAEGERWVSAADFAGGTAVVGRARGRFGPVIATFDADGDGRADVFLGAAVAGPKGVRDALLLNRGDGKFEDVSRAWGLPDDRPSLAAAAGDFDADRRVDLFLTALDGYHLLHNVGAGAGGWKDVTASVGMDKVRALGVSARWLDLDQDGDLDLYVANYTDLDHAGQALVGEVPKVLNAAFRNVGKPAKMPPAPENNWAPLAVAPPDAKASEGLSLQFTAWPDADALVGPAAHSTALAALYLDGDRDLDLVVGTDGDGARAVLNDRLGKFHAGTMSGFATGSPLNGLLVIDLDKDGRADLVGLTDGTTEAYRNATPGTNPSDEIVWQSWPCNAKAWRMAAAHDLDLDTWADLVGLPVASDGPTLEWARNERDRSALGTLAVGPVVGEVKALSGFAAADFVGDALPDVLLLGDNAAPQLARDLGNGEHWLALDLGGRWKTSFDHMRTNVHGLGTRIRVEGEGLLATCEVTTPTTGPGQSVAPVILGLGKNPSAELLRLSWPDGTIQCELNAKGDTKLALSEYNRKTGSCPVLFTWNGRRFVCLGDFLGGGGLGYLVAPGVYSQPDRDESVAIAADQLAAVDGTFRLSITEPMDEVAYLDKLELVAVDRPPGVSMTPDERFAPEGQRPTGEPIAWRRAVRPTSARDLKGNDVTETLAAWDRRTADGFDRLNGWVGYAEEHGIVLDFGDRLTGFGPTQPLVLVMAGWVEYPYSQTNYAAATAGVPLLSPRVERLHADGSWKLIEPNAGYPAGLPRRTTLDLTGKLGGPSCVLRLRTNMECYWDEAFVALRDAGAEASLVQSALPVARAVLGHRGYTREVSPDGRLPLLYDYDYVDPAPLALMGGKLTRHGDVTPLLNGDDDQFCMVGPGDEVRLEFDAQPLPTLAPGWSRSYVLKTVGYCKDADPYTATGDSVEPLPWRDMPSFPFLPGAAKRRPDVAYEEHLKRYQTRPAGLR